MFNNFFFLENYVVYEIRWKNTLEHGRATDDNMPHAHCMLDDLRYKYALGICNTYWFSTATIVAKTRFRVTLYVPCCLVYTYV